MGRKVHILNLVGIEKGECIAENAIQERWEGMRDLPKFLIETRRRGEISNKLRLERKRRGEMGLHKIGLNKKGDGQNA